MMTEKPLDITKIDQNISALEQLFPKNCKNEQNVNSITLHFNVIEKLNNGIFHLLPNLKKLDLSANKLDNAAIDVLRIRSCV